MNCYDRYLYRGWGGVWAKFLNAKSIRRSATLGPISSGETGTPVGTKADGFAAFTGMISQFCSGIAVVGERENIPECKKRCGFPTVTMAIGDMRAGRRG